MMWFEVSYLILKDNDGHNNHDYDDDVNIKADARIWCDV